MDPKPFRCVYDPALSGSRSQGSKPIIRKPRVGERATDPRTTREPATHGKRRVPQGPPKLPEFARKLVAAAPKRCLIGGLDPLTTRTQVVDAMQAFGLIEDCQVATSQLTGASLGVAWALFAPSETQAVSRVVAAARNGQLHIGGTATAAAVSVSADADGAILARRVKKLEEMQRLPPLGPSPASQKLGASNAAGAAAAVDSPVVSAAATASTTAGAAAVRSNEKPQLVDVRILNKHQVDEWYRLYIGPKPTYVILTDRSLLKEVTHGELERWFSEYKFKHIAMNLTGAFVVFESEVEACRCYIGKARRPLRGRDPRLCLTLGGRREKYEYARKVCAAETSSPSQRGRAAPNAAASKTLRPGERAGAAADSRAGLRPTAAVLATAAESITADLKRDLKAGVWSAMIAGFVAKVTNRELAALRKAGGTSDSDGSGDGKEAASGDDESKENGGLLSPAGTPTSFGFTSSVGFGKMGSSYGGARPKSQAASLMRIRKRNLAPDSAASATSSSSAGGIFSAMAQPPTLKKRKLQVAVPAPNSFVRAVLEDMPEARKSESPFTEMESHMGSPQSEPSSDAMDVDSDGEAVSDDETHGMDLPPTPASPLHAQLGVAEVQRLVKTDDDFAMLKTIVDSAPSPVGVDEEEVINAFKRGTKPTLVDVPANWPPAAQAVPFRAAPYRARSDDERRTYLPNLGPGVPNEIVQNYAKRPLFEGVDEEEEHESRVESRVINMSRSAFGLNSELFADDNLSKNAKDTRLARSAIHDWGLYANEHIPANEFVIEYVGDILRDEYAEVRERNYAIEGIESTYLFRLDNGTVIDATKRGNGARFINHSCAPNCTAQVFDYDGFQRVVLFSLREISPDEELTFDYNFVMSQDEDGRVRCACGAENCRGWLM